MQKGIGLFIQLFLLSCIPLGILIGVAAQRVQITPNDQFFNVSIGSSPNINIDTWRLKVDGDLDNSRSYTYQDIMDFPTINITATLTCVDGPSGTALWTGFHLLTFLERLGLKNESQEVVFYCADGYSTSLTLEEVSSSDVILCYQMNGENLPIDQGYPLRLIAPNHLGYKWAKWITHIEVVNYDYHGYWESRGWADNAATVPVQDWITHAFLFSIAFLFGVLSLISGLKLTPNINALKELPDFVSRKFHFIMSILFVLTSIGTFIYWSLETFQNRGAIYYTIHGILALISVIFIIGTLLTAFRKLKGNKTRDLHSKLGIYAIIVFIIVMIAGYFLTRGNILI